MRNLKIETISRWMKMVSGKSIYHVNQGLGQYYSKDMIQGYYNDLTEKVLKDKDTVLGEVPTFVVNGKIVEFPIAIFQYGLGAYDLYFSTKNTDYLTAFSAACEWAIKFQEENGSWNNFHYIYPETPYSSMAQGEGVSLLCRAYKEFNEDRFLVAATKALEFMIIDVELGGTTKYDNEDIYFLEYTHKPVVLNGWIFSIFGLYDYLLVQNNKRYEGILSVTVNTLKKRIEAFDNGYWSKYNLSNMLTSPFYHDLHIAQLWALHDLFGYQEFKVTANRWETYKSISLNRKRAFVIKAIQKLRE